MRLLHTADWHLGRLLHNLSLLDDQRLMLDQLLDIVDREKVDAVLIAGDIYDRSRPQAPRRADEPLLCGRRQRVRFRASADAGRRRKRGLGADAPF
jgi:exonuclease SbcD